MERGKAMPRRLKTQFLCDLEQLPSPPWAPRVPLPGVQTSVAEPARSSLTDCFSIKSDKAVPGSYSGASVGFLSMWVFRWLVSQFSNNTWWFCS